jgi:2-polyprenyl-3-methyl-5-hydroxy-6-metoxy-1,4-benzoquinol methylase
MTSSLSANPWDEHAAEYSAWIARRESAGIGGDPIMTRLLESLGDIDGKSILDACCGEGFLARVLAARGACVTGIDLSPRLIDAARQKDPSTSIDYRVADLSQGIPDLYERFDAIGSYMALNDVADYRGFAATLSDLAKANGLVVVAFNNPYSSVVREHITDYFSSGTLGTYAGLGRVGVHARYYHRTLEEYVDAFLAAGLRLVRLADVPDRPQPAWLLPPDRVFPRFMVLAFQKPH